MIGRYGPPIFQICRGLKGAYNVALLKVIPKEGVSRDFLYYFLKQDSVFQYVDKLSARTGGQTGVDLVSLKEYPVRIPEEIECQEKLVTILSVIDKKIALNNRINTELEAMAKTLYDYWFVQFDFPNEEGKPYKSSGGEMVWNEKLKREIPKRWKDITLNAFIDKNKGGDWGYDTSKDGTIKIGCVRGADIIKLNDVPTRHITSKHSDRLLEDGDIVIEISGGSPVQATGRVALITKGVIERNGGALVCSNFCQSFSM